VTAAVVILYLVILVGIGAASSRRSLPSAEDYFLAGRSFGTIVLFMALFGTNVTAFAMLGLPGKAYHAGISVFGFFGASAAVCGPLMLAILGYPIWLFGKRHGFITPSQMFADRWRSRPIGLLILGLMLLYTLPYLIIGIIGGALALNQLGGASLTYEWSAVLITAVTVFYTSVGGMRGTAWTNVFQATVFLVFLTVAAVGIANQLGGATTLYDRLSETAPQLLHDHIPPGKWATGILVGPVSIIAFPHMFIRLLTARNANALRRSIQLYPWALIALFLPVTLLGAWGAVAVPGLEGKDSDYILPTLVAQFLPTWLSAVGLAAILAAVMSSLDAQLLTLSTLLSVDLFHRSEDGRRWGRICVLGIAVVALIVALRREAIFNVSVFAFSGYTLIIPVMIAGFFWKRSTAAGVIAGSLAGHGLLWAYTIGPERLGLPAASSVFPVVICLGAEILVLIAVSLSTRPPNDEVVARFAQPFGPE
jgi:SSS family solute:Na+ symporter